MLTVKHVDTNGSENIVSVNSVSFDKEANCLIGLGANGVGSIRWTSGSAFVMNEQGKTVGVYNLSMRLGTTDVTNEQAEKARATAKQQQS